MPEQIICKSHKDPIKTKMAMLPTRLNMLFFGMQGQVTPKWLAWFCQNSNSSQDFTPVQVICNFHQDSIKTEQAMLRSKVEYGIFWH